MVPTRIVKVVRDSIEGVEEMIFLGSRMKVIQLIMLIGIFFVFQGETSCTSSAIVLEKDGKVKQHTPNKNETNVEWILNYEKDGAVSHLSELLLKKL